MYDYRELKARGTPVSQTIDAPILIFDHLQLGDAFAALACVLVFGVIFYEWKLMMLLLVLILGIGPVIRKKYPRGIFLHLPYRYLGISLPGLFNPRGRRKFSD